MLFDLRSRGRRRTVQVIYVGLALIMVGGLLLVGVGTGSNQGGLLNAFTNNGSGGDGGQVVSAQLTAAEKAVKKAPDSAAAWSQMVQAQYIVANEGSNYNSDTGTYTTQGKAELGRLTQSWERYASLTSSPNSDNAIYAANAYAQLGDWAGEAGAWELYTLAQPTSVHGFECLAAAAYAAKQSRKAGLAAAKALSLTPKLEQLQVKAVLEEAKTSSAVAQGC